MRNKFADTLYELAKNNPKLSSKLREEEEKSRQEYEIMVKKCDELMETIRRCDQRIIESINWDLSASRSTM